MLKSSDFLPLRNKARQYQNIKTGEIVSRRQYQKVARGGLTNEQFAEFNKITNPKLAASMPARGRKSILKLPKNERDVIAQARIEDAKQKAAILKDKKEAKLLEQRIAKASAKKVKRKKIRPHLLKAGNKGARISFNNYGEYLDAFNEGKNTFTTVNGKRVPLLIAYGIGMVGVSEKDGKELGITIFTMRAFDSPIDEDDFNDMVQDELVERPYFLLSHFFMHLAFSIDYAKQKRDTALSRKGKN